MKEVKAILNERYQGQGTLRDHIKNDMLTVLNFVLRVKPTTVIELRKQLQTKLPSTIILNALFMMNYIHYNTKTKQVELIDKGKEAWSMLEPEAWIYVSNTGCNLEELYTVVAQQYQATIRFNQFA